MHRPYNVKFQIEAGSQLQAVASFQQIIGGVSVIFGGLSLHNVLFLEQ